MDLHVATVRWGVVRCLFSLAACSALLESFPTDRGMLVTKKSCNSCMQCDDCVVEGQLVPTQHLA